MTVTLDDFDDSTVSEALRAFRVEREASARTDPRADACLVLDTALETAQWEFAVAMSIADSIAGRGEFQLAAIRAEAAYQSAKVRAWELYRARMSELSEATR